MQAISVYCGSSPGLKPEYAEAARQLGRALAGRGITLVYGGGRTGLMGTIADAALAQGGRVIGVIPADIAEHEIQHNGLTELHVVTSMHERKMLMTKLSDAMIAMPGGLGTLEELFEVWTWAQLGFHTKPCGLLNVEAYFDQMLAFLDNAVSQRFVKQTHRDFLYTDTDPVALVERMQAYKPAAADKWLDLDKT